MTFPSELKATPKISGTAPRAPIQTDASFRQVHDKAFNPRRIGFADQEARPVIIDPFVVSAAKVMSMSHRSIVHRARRQGNPI
jgi:hypothetical protein